MPFTDVRGLVEYAKANPVKLTDASSGNGTDGALGKGGSLASVRELKAGEVAERLERL